MSKLICIIVLFSSVSHSYGQTRRREIIKYEKRQKIDLGAIMIDGQVVSPGDFSIQDEKQKASELLYKRKNYNDRLRINIQYVF